jgi:predicted XRE-type DNA-binding protein
MKPGLHDFRKDIEDQQRKQKQRMLEEGEQWIRLRCKIVLALADKRKELGISQNEIANALNTTQGSITRFESQTLYRKGAPVTPHNPTLKFLSAYAEALGCEIGFHLIPCKVQEFDGE